MGEISIYVSGDTRHPICLLLGIWEQKTFYYQVMNFTAAWPVSVFWQLSFRILSTNNPLSRFPIQQCYIFVDTDISHYILADLIPFIIVVVLFRVLVFFFFTSRACEQNQIWDTPLVLKQLIFMEWETFASPFPSCFLNECSDLLSFAKIMLVMACWVGHMA